MGYYVYVLLDDRYLGNYNNIYNSEINYKPFYVGKGLTSDKNQRHLFHYKQNCEKSVNPHKCRTIKILKESNFEPNYIIVYESNDEQKVLNVEMELIKFYGKKNDGGILTNITDGGVGGNIFKFIPGLQDKLIKLASDRWSGKNNPNYGKPLSDNFSHQYKIKNNRHWNEGKKMGDSLKEKLKFLRNKNLPMIQMLDTKTGEILDELTTVSAINKYNLSPTRLYNCLKNGGVHKQFHWKFKEKELVILKSLREDYVKPKRINSKIKKIYFKHHFDDEYEYEFKNVTEASINTNYCVGVIRKKCRKNTKKTNIFRYENSEYKLELTGDGRLPIVRIDVDGNKTIFNSVTEAANSLENGSQSMIVLVCKGKRKKHKGYKFEYLNKKK